MLILVPFALLSVGLALLAWVQKTHIAWVKREFRKNTIAHDRILRAVPIIPADRRKTSLWPSRQAAPVPEDWSDDFSGTQDVSVVE